MREFSRKKAHREHLIRNLATSLILYEKVDTTAAKAKEVKSYLDQLLSRTSAGDLNAIRHLNSVLFDRNATKKVVTELVARYQKRQSGHIRSFPLKNRVGDNSPMIRLELVDKKVFVSDDSEAKEKTSAKTASAEEKENQKVEENAGK